jgi:hypothetical protein
MDMASRAEAKLAMVLPTKAIQDMAPPVKVKLGEVTLWTKTSTKLACRIIAD